MPKINIALTFLLLTVCLTGTGWIFWEVDFQFRTPTPIPSDFKPVDNVVLSQLEINEIDSEGSIVLLHFYNPDCPCSKFNLKHVKELQFKYGQKLKIIAIVPPWGDFQKAQKQCDFMHQVILDQNYNLAQACGVYSTPQAIVFGMEGQMIYKGNYNLNRYCTNKETQFVRIALEQTLANERNSAIASKNIPAYGCSIFQCNK